MLIKIYVIFCIQKMTMQHLCVKYVLNHINNLLVNYIFIMNLMIIFKKLYMIVVINY